MFVFSFLFFRKSIISHKLKRILVFLLYLRNALYSVFRRERTIKGFKNRLSRTIFLAELFEVKTDFSGPELSPFFNFYPSIQTKQRDARIPSSMA